MPWAAGEVGRTLIRGEITHLNSALFQSRLAEKKRIGAKEPWLQILRGVWGRGIEHVGGKHSGGNRQQKKNPYIVRISKEFELGEGVRKIAKSAC